jgi:hypothetical protein
MKEFRNLERHAGARATVRVGWLGRDGAPRAVEAKVLNYSERGLAFEIPEEIARFTMLKLRSAKLGIDGSGVVRNCRSGAGMRTIVGVELVPPGVG